MTPVTASTLITFNQLIVNDLPAFIIAIFDSRSKSCQRKRKDVGKEKISRLIVNSVAIHLGFSTKWNDK